jgi:hypothetical protein
MVGGADVGRRLGVKGSELAGEAHAVPIRVGPHRLLPLDPMSWTSPQLGYIYHHFDVPHLAWMFNGTKSSPNKEKPALLLLGLGSGTSMDCNIGRKSIGCYKNWRN